MAIGRHVMKSSILNKIKVVSKSGYMPEYATEGSAGADLKAYLPDKPGTFMPGERRLIPTGLFV